MNPDEVQAFLAWSSLPKVGERTLLALMDRARESRRGLLELWRGPVADVDGFLPSSPLAQETWKDASGTCWERAGEDLRAIRAQGVDLLCCTEPDSPAVLSGTGGSRRRPFLFAFGALGLLEEPRVAIVNSRDASIPSLLVTDALADALARRDVALVTSTNRESYRAAATAAKRHAAPTVMVLDRSVSAAFPGPIRREPVASARVWDEAFDPDLQLLLSPFAWRERWSQGAGGRRDALVVDLADVVVAIDVRPGGIIDQEVRRAAAAGKCVLAVDRTEESHGRASRLWEGEGAAERLGWKSAEDTAQEVLRRLPGASAGRERAGGERTLSGWQRELAQFLIRACALLHGPTARPTVAAFPPAGVPADVARRWSHRAEAPRSGATYLLADLVYAGAPAPDRPTQLLGRVATGGMLAAVMPAEWLDGERHARVRSEWLQHAVLRLAARLPSPAGASSECPAAAAVVLQRGGPRDGAPAIFAPSAETMGRFHLRRYLQEVLAALPAEGSARAAVNLGTDGH